MSSTEQLEIHQFPILSDNYGVLIRDAATGAVASIDCGDAAAIAAELGHKKWKLTHILTTHHHGDHTDGNLELQRLTGCTIIGPRAEAARIPGINSQVGGGDTFKFGGHTVHVLDTPGHTLGHISFYFPDSYVAFVGDTLFPLGCGRVIEGTMEMMWASLARVAALPPATMIYAGHEYTAANAKFALTIEPENAALQARAKQITALRAAGQPTLPTQLALELATNPFLRVASTAIQQRLAMPGAKDWQIFGEIRERKNRS
jgi:hydroxyacylglutathione hydrolase